MTRSLKRAGDGAHQRTLGTIAIAAAAEHRDQPAGRERPRSVEQVSERVIGVGVVHDHSDFVYVFGNDLEPSGHAAESAEAPFNRGERQVERHGGGDGREDVVDVGAPDQT